jgi:hypothetical protein
MKIIPARNGRQDNEMNDFQDSTLILCFFIEYDVLYTLVIYAESWA